MEAPCGVETARLSLYAPRPPPLFPQTGGAGPTVESSWAKIEREIGPAGEVGLSGASETLFGPCLSVRPQYVTEPR
jgi:hypothetical protein